MKKEKASKKDKNEATTEKAETNKQQKTTEKAASTT